MFRGFRRLMVTLGLAGAMATTVLAVSGEAALADGNSSGPQGVFVATYLSNLDCAWAAFRFTTETGRQYFCSGADLYMR